MSIQKKWMAATCVAFCLLYSVQNSLAGWGIFQSYVFLEDGSETGPFAGGINPDGAAEFSGHDFGMFHEGTSLILNGGELKTFKNQSSNVCGGILSYRVYPAGNPSGQAELIALNYAGELGGGDQKWNATGAGINLLSGLSTGNYVLEVYWQAEGNEFSSGACGEYQYDNGGGANFTANFSVICSEDIDFDGICDDVDPSIDVPLFGPPLSTAPHGLPTLGAIPADLPSDRWGENLSGPLPTNAWWMDLTLLNPTYGSYGRINCFPYQMRATEGGMEVWVPEVQATSTYVTTTASANWLFSTAESGLSHQVVDYDPLSVTVEFSNGTGGAKMSMPLVRGMAHVSGHYLQATPKLTTSHAIVAIEDASGNSLQPGNVFSGDNFTLTLNNNQVWKLYSSASVAWNWTGGELSATEQTSDVWVRLALATWSNSPANWPSEYYTGQDLASNIALLDAHKDAIPTGGTVSAVVEGNSANLSFSWEHAAGSSGNFLVYSLPHHREILSEMAEENFWVRTHRGVMQGVSASTWTMTEPLSTITWDAPRAVPVERQDEVIAALSLSEAYVATDPRPYDGGKQLEALGRLVLIADEMNQTELAETFRTNLSNALSPWMDGSTTYPLSYDPFWGGVIPGNNPPYYGTYEMDKYNDQHFQYGHFIYAAAVMAKDNPEWVTNHGDVVMQLIRNIANPSSSDPLYTFMRNKDWFVGHSLASGIVPWLDGRNQESTSEAVNAWYAIALYGEAIGDTRIKDLGRLMLATELRSTHLYWQMDSADEIYPDVFEANKVVGQLFDAKATYSTFFGDNIEYIHGIQMLPFTPITEELLRSSWVAEEYPVVSEALNSSSIEEDWKGFIYGAHAVIEPVQAWDEMLSLTAFDSGNPPANALYWAATRPNAVPSGLTEPTSGSSMMTFSLDLNGVEGTHAPFVAGPFNGWCSTCNPLNDPDADGIYTANIAVSADLGIMPYKFINDGAWEDLSAGMSCTTTDGSGNTNRFVEFDLGHIVYQLDTVLASVCFESCSDCSSPPVVADPLTITATVCEAVSELTLTGPWWNWGAGPVASDNGDGTWTFTFDPAPTDDMEYLLVADGVQENLIQAAIDGGSCVGNTDYSSYANRVWTVGTGDVNGIVYGSCASGCPTSVAGCTDENACNYNAAATTDDGSCTGIAEGNCDCDGNTLDACGNCGGTGTDQDGDGICDNVDLCTDTSACNFDANPTESCIPCPSEDVQITFQVDVSDEPYSGELLVYLTGSFETPNPWCGNCIQMTDGDGDGTFEVTIGLQPGSQIEYKYTIGGWAYSETLESGSSCTLTTGEYTNRVYVIPDASAAISTVCFGSCAACPETGCIDETACNFDSNAVVDDGSCVYLVDACDVCNADGTVTNPDIDADGTCDALDNCSDTMACNYADPNNGPCVFADLCGVCGGDGLSCSGCLDSSACNYDATATVSGNCIYANDPCEICNENGGVTLQDADEDGVCDGDEVLGCQDSSACNFNQAATDAGACVFADDPCEVCDADGGVILQDADEDGVCDGDEVLGCQDSSACNFNQAATDAGACVFADDPCEVCDADGGVILQDADEDGVCDGDEITGCQDSSACNFNQAA
ncbi:MAG: glycosyl hydrolase, partial [Flavobacteriales bacterium]